MHRTSPFAPRSRLNHFGSRVLLSAMRTRMHAHGRAEQTVAPRTEKYFPSDREFLFFRRTWHYSIATCIVSLVVSFVDRPTTVDDASDFAHTTAHTICERNIPFKTNFYFVDAADAHMFGHSAFSMNISHCLRNFSRLTANKRLQKPEVNGEKC